MTIKDAIDYADRIKPNAFPADIKTVWLNEIEGRIQADVMLLAAGEIRDYVYSSEETKAGVSFPTSATMRLPRRAKVRAGGLLTIAGLGGNYAANNLECLEIEAVSEDGKELSFAEGTFAATGIAGERATLIFDGSECELLVPAPWCRLYYSYLLMRISEHLEESAEQNNRRETFIEDYTHFAVWFASTYRPADEQAGFKGYYIRGENGASGITPTLSINENGHLIATYG